MYIGAIFVTLIYALVLAGAAFVPGLAALVLALATRRHAGSYRDGELSGAGCLWVAAHELSRRVCVVLLAASCGFLGAGLLSVFLNVAVLAFALIADSVAPTNGDELDMTLLGLLYFGALTVGFLVFFAMGMDRLVRWLKPPPGTGKSQSIESLDALP